MFKKVQQQWGKNSKRVERCATVFQFCTDFTRILLHQIMTPSSTRSVTIRNNATATLVGLLPSVKSNTPTSLKVSLNKCLGSVMTCNTVNYILENKLTLHIQSLFALIFCRPGCSDSRDLNSSSPVADNSGCWRMDVWQKV